MEKLTFRQTILTERQETQRAKRNYIKQHLQYSKRLLYIPTLLKLAFFVLLCTFFYYMGIYDTPTTICDEQKICYYNLICPETNLPATGAE